MKTYQPIRGMHVLAEGQGDYVKRSDYEQANERADMAESVVHSIVDLSDELELAARTISAEGFDDSTILKVLAIAKARSCETLETAALES